jgi:hypothetical protein
MDKKNLNKIKGMLLEMSRYPRNRNYKDFISIAKKLGREKDKRGKEPTYTRKHNPKLSPPLSIPKHSGDMKIGTAQSIIDALLSDVDEWEIYLNELESKSG